MAKEYRIKIHGEQREVIDADLMARLVLMLGRQLARDAKEAAAAVYPELDDQDVLDADGLYRLDARRRDTHRKADEQ